MKRTDNSEAKNRRAYPKNVNIKTCAPSTLKFHTFSGIHETKKCWKIEFDILNSSGVIASQKYIEYIFICGGGGGGGGGRGYKWAIFSYFILLGDFIK